MTLADFRYYECRLPVLRTLSLWTCRRQSPVQQPGVIFALFNLAVSALPDTAVGSACTSTLSRLAQRSLALPPAHLRCHQFARKSKASVAKSTAARLSVTLTLRQGRCTSTSPKCCQLRTSRKLAGKLNRRVLSMIEGISAVTLGTHEMPGAVRFYRALGFEVLHGGEDSSSPAFGQGRAISISSPSLPSGAGPGGGG
jgi:hypothetical protein